ncbi:MAG: chloride channel protein [Proteobacteria bacterium]|nr:chloride channel protein [Pseudomonadota bacterium]
MNINKIKTIAALACTATLATAFLLLYCRTFYDFSNLAKERILISPLYAFFTTPILFWVSAYLCRRFSLAASGNNMGNIESAVNEIDKSNNHQKASFFLGFKTISICALSSLVSTFGAGSLGHEGPSVQISAGIFFNAANKIKNFLPKISLENWIYVGAGIGLAVAFGAPFAGLICVCEKSFKVGSKKILSNFFWTIPAILIFALITPKSSSIFCSETANLIYRPKEIALIFLLVIFCGAIAILFKKISSHFYRKFVAIKSPKWHLVPIISGLIVSIIASHYGPNSIGSGLTMINSALANTDASLSYEEVIARIITTILTFISGSAGGFVAPSIAVGAGIGSVVGQILSSIDPKIFILSGMAAFLSATIGMPITAAMIIFETTSQTFFIFPLLLSSSLIAFCCTKIFIKRA